MAFDAFLKIDGIEGESPDSKHSKEIRNAPSANFWSHFDFAGNKSHLWKLLTQNGAKLGG